MNNNKIVSICVKSSFTAAHWHDKALSEPLHKHNFNYFVTLKGPLNAEGFLVDFRALWADLEKINALLGGKELNTIFRYPTTENLAIFIFEELAKIYPQINRVEVTEHEGCSAIYEG